MSSDEPYISDPDGERLRRLAEDARARAGFEAAMARFHIACATAFDDRASFDACIAVLEEAIEQATWFGHLPGIIDGIDATLDMHERYARKIGELRDQRYSVTLSWYWGQFLWKRGREEHAYVYFWRGLELCKLDYLRGEDREASNFRSMFEMALIDTRRLAGILGRTGEQAKLDDLSRWLDCPET